MKLRYLLAALTVSVCMAQDPGAPRTYLAKMSVPVSTDKSKVGDPVRAFIISPESLLNGWLAGVVEAVKRGRGCALTMRFTSVEYKGTSTPIESEVIDFVNSKGHKDVDDHERPVKLEGGTFNCSGNLFWLDEGAEVRVRAARAP